jgi:NADH:ubiquinone oxidoreductase subunit C
MKEVGARLACISLYNKKLIYHFERDGRYDVIERPNRDVKSIQSIFPNAEFFERELAEKFNVKFDKKMKKLFTE